MTIVKVNKKMYLIKTKKAIVPHPEPRWGAHVYLWWIHFDIWQN